MDDERKKINGWDKIENEKPEDTLLNKPRRFLWSIKEILLLLQAFVWHKKRSLRARRREIDYNLNNALRELKYAEELTEDTIVKDNIEEAREDIQNVYKELELKSYRRYRNMPYDKIKEFEDDEN